MKNPNTVEYTEIPGLLHPDTKEQTERAELRVNQIATVQGTTIRTVRSALWITERERYIPLEISLQNDARDAKRAILIKQYLTQSGLTLIGLHNNLTKKRGIIYQEALEHLHIIGELIHITAHETLILIERMYINIKARIARGFAGHTLIDFNTSPLMCSPSDGKMPLDVSPSN